MAEKEDIVTAADLPVVFQVKYLGQRDAGGLWGIKHTRRPVDNMVSAAKNIPAGHILPLVKLVISTTGVQLEGISVHKSAGTLPTTFYNIESISYGVQDLVYTRVFSMIVVRENINDNGQTPFDCHAFVCDSRNSARRLTYALAAAFQEYSKRVKTMQAENASDVDGETPKQTTIKKRFAIDLRTPEELEADLNAETEA